VLTHDAPSAQGVRLVTQVEKTRRRAPHSRLAPGTRLSARHIVDEAGKVLCEGEPVAVAGRKRHLRTCRDLLAFEEGPRQGFSALPDAENELRVVGHLLRRPGRIPGELDLDFLDAGQRGDHVLHVLLDHRTRWATHRGEAVDRLHPRAVDLDVVQKPELAEGLRYPSGSSRLCLPPDDAARCRTGVTF